MMLHSSYGVMPGRCHVMEHGWTTGVELQALTRCAHAEYRAHVPMKKKLRLLSSSHTAMKELLGTLNFFFFKINAFFAALTSGFTLITPSDVAAIVVPDMPSESLVLSCKAYRALRAVKWNKACGPDGILNCILKTFAFDLGPVIEDLYNTSLREGFVPSLLESAIICPMFKQRLPQSIEYDLRPISLTCHITKIMEGFTLLRVLPGFTSRLDPKQIAVSGKSTQHALVYLLHIVLEALDRGNSWFFADFKKGIRSHWPSGNDEKDTCSQYTPLLSALDCDNLRRQDTNCRVSALVIVSIEIKWKHSPGEKTVSDLTRYYRWWPFVWLVPSSKIC